MMRLCCLPATFHFVTEMIIQDDLLLLKSFSRLISTSYVDDYVLQSKIIPGGVNDNTPLCLLE